MRRQSPPLSIKLRLQNMSSCSEIKKHSYVPITYHKTGNTIQIVSQELSDLVHKSQRRR